MKTKDPICPKCGKTHHIFKHAPSDAFRYARCGQAYKRENVNGVAVPNTK